MLTKPDKGSGIVLLNKNDYVDKMSYILNDGSKFTQATGDKDYTSKAETQLTECLKRLRKANFISDNIFERIRPSGTVIPRLYGLPKIHKPDVPLRPILDMCNSPYHATAKWLAEILEPIRHDLCQHSLRDSFEFVDLVKGINMNSKYMCSFDVSSLFTNVPLMETIDYICNYIDSSNVNIPLPTNALKELLIRCTWNVQFKFDGIIYRQIDGVAMGSPLGPLLSDIFMSSLENNYLKDSINSVLLYCRYIDDIFIIVNDMKDIPPLLDVFNSAHSSITFTMEPEKDRSFNFLDVLLSKRPDNSLKLSVYRKPTWTGQYTHFNSYVPLSQKRNLVRTLAYRARRICSNDTVEDELLHIIDILKNNGYPERFVSRNMKTKSENNVILTANKKPIFINLPFKGDQAADNLNHRLQKSLKRTYAAASLKSLFKTRPLLHTSVKDKLPVHSQNMVVYSFICSCTAEYVG
ncbi:MAG: reverse transcriptase domain-containing protein, partial [Lactococcus garvieae]